MEFERGEADVEDSGMDGSSSQSDSSDRVVCHGDSGKHGFRENVREG